MSKEKYDVDPTYQTNHLPVEVPASAERRLLWAILERAIFDYLGQVPRSDKRMIRDAEYWIFSDLDHDCSYTRICEELDLSPQTMRIGLALLRERRENAEKKMRPLPKGVARPRGEFVRAIAPKKRMFMSR